MATALLTKKNESELTLIAMIKDGMINYAKLFSAFGMSFNVTREWVLNTYSKKKFVFNINEFEKHKQYLLMPQLKLF